MMSIKERIIADDKKRECLLLFFLFQFMQIMFDKATTRLTIQIEYCIAKPIYP